MVSGGKDGCVELIEILVRVVEALAPEPTPDVLGVDVHLLFLQPQRFGQRRPGGEDALLGIPKMKVVALPRRRADVRLDRQRDLPARHVASLDDQVGLGKSRLEVPDPRLPCRHVGWLWTAKSAHAATGVNLPVVAPQVLFDIREDLEHVPADVDQVERLLGDVLGIGGHDRDGLADEAGTS